MRLTFVGHSTVRMQSGGAVLVSDPVLRSRVAFLRSTAVHPPAAAASPVAVAVVSHLHRDHCDLASLRSLGAGLTLVVPIGTETFFTDHGFTRVVALDVGESSQVAGFAVTATEAEHDGRRGRTGAYRRASGYVIEAGGVRVYFAGDTDLFDAMAELNRPDVALLPVWGWGRTIGPGHLDPERAAQAVDVIRPRVAVPIHWGTLRPIWHKRRAHNHPASPAMRFAEAVRARQLPSTAKVLLPGESIDC